MRTTLTPLILLLALGCEKKVIKEGVGGVGGDTGGDVIDGEEVPVWDDNRHATSVNFMSAYSTGTDLYVVTTEGQTWHYNGGDWSNIATSVDEVDLTGIWGSGSGATLKMFAVGHEGQILEWELDQWTYTDVGSAAFSAIDGTTATDLIAVGGAGAWTNRSGDWEAMTNAQHKFNDVWYDGTFSLAVGDEGSLGWLGREESEFDNPETEGGWIFDEVPDVDAHLYGVDATNLNNIWVVGQSGTVLNWNGVTWRSIDLGTQNNIWSVWTPDTGIAYVVGQNGMAFRIDGTEVEKLPTGIPNVLYNVTGTTEANVWATGARGVALQYPAE